LKKEIKECGKRRKGGLEGGGVKGGGCGDTICCMSGKDTVTSKKYKRKKKV